MGQAVILPENITKPSKELLHAMLEAGITPDRTSNHSYLLPQNWKILDDSTRHTHDIPFFYIVDDRDYARFLIRGNLYDEMLEISQVAPCRITPRVQQCEGNPRITQNLNIIMNLFQTCS